MKHILNEIKSQLFDAPTEIKSSFNTVVRYFTEAEFDSKDRYKACLCDLGYEDNFGIALIVWRKDRAQDMSEKPTGLIREWDNLTEDAMIKLLIEQVSKVDNILFVLRSKDIQEMKSHIKGFDPNSINLFDYTNADEYIIASCEKSQDKSNPTNWKIKKVKGSELNKKNDKIILKVLSKIAKVDKK